MDTILNDLPAIVVRLKTLEQVHQSALSVDTRVSAMESIVNELSAEVACNNDVILSIQEVRYVCLYVCVSVYMPF